MDPTPQIVPPAAPAPEPVAPTPNATVAAPQPTVATPPPPAEEPGFSWEASEYLHHSKPASWYVLFGAVVVVLVAVAVLTQQWLSIGVFIAMAVALMVYAHKAPRTLSYRLDGKGITIGAKFYPYDHFRSYGILRDVGWHALDLEPTQRFMPRLTIMFDDADLPAIESALTTQLPKVDRHPDWIERLSRYLKF